MWASDLSWAQHLNGVSTTVPLTCVCMEMCVLSMWSFTLKDFLFILLTDTVFGNGKTTRLSPLRQHGLYVSAFGPSDPHKASLCPPRCLTLCPGCPAVKCSFCVEFGLTEDFCSLFCQLFRHWNENEADLLHLKQKLFGSSCQPTVSHLILRLYNLICLCVHATSDKNLSLSQFVVITVCLKAGLETSSWTMVSVWMTLSIPLSLFSPISLCPPISFDFIVPLSVETCSSTPSHSSHLPFSSRKSSEHSKMMSWLHR